MGNFLFVHNPLTVRIVLLGYTESIALDEKGNYFRFVSRRSNSGNRCYMARNGVGSDIDSRLHDVIRVIPVIS